MLDALAAYIDKTLEADAAIGEAEAPAAAAAATAGANVAAKFRAEDSPGLPTVKKAVLAGLTPEQESYIDDLIATTIRRTPKAKAETQTYRSVLADPRTVQGFRSRWKEMVYPVLSDQAKGSKIWDVDGNEYIDLVCGYGVTMLGTSRPSWSTRSAPSWTVRWRSARNRCWRGKSRRWFANSPAWNAWRSATPVPKPSWPPSAWRGPSPASRRSPSSTATTTASSTRFRSAAAAPAAARPRCPARPASPPRRSRTPSSSNTATRKPSTSCARTSTTSRSCLSNRCAAATRISSRANTCSSCARSRKNSASRCCSTRWSPASGPIPAGLRRSSASAPTSRPTARSPAAGCRSAS